MMLTAPFRILATLLLLGIAGGLVGCSEAGSDPTPDAVATIRAVSDDYYWALAYGVYEYDGPRDVNQANQHIADYLWSFVDSSLGVLVNLNIPGDRVPPLCWLYYDLFISVKQLENAATLEEALSTASERLSGRRVLFLGVGDAVGGD